MENAGLFAFASAADRQFRKKNSASSLMAAFGSFESTREIPIPRQPLEQIVGQDEAVRIAYIAAKQRRNLLLVGPPGTGKSLLAQAISFHLPRPTEEVNVLHNPETPERPLVEVRTLEQIEKEKRMMREVQGRLVTPQEVPAFVAERLGFACRRCGQMSSPRHPACQSCGGEKFLKEQAHSPFGDLVNPYFEDEGRQDRVHTTRLDPGGREEVVVYERADDRRVRVLDQAYLEKMDSLRKKTPRKTLAPISRRPFVVATGASETELLGDVRHDPYGGHPALGTPPYLRVVPGAVHEAHEGVLFIDEISALAYIQRFLLTAMQEKKYPIVGRNPHGAGASVKVENAPCDFLLIAASNINDIPNILPPLRSRILGNGYEVLLQTTMADSAQNRAKLAQFAAQEVRKDGRIPHFSRGGIEALIGEARRRAKTMDKTDAALTLRLRELSGIIRLAGDIAKISGKELADAKDVTLAVERGRSIEEQLTKRYGSLYKASMGDVGAAEPSEGKEVS